MIEEGCKVIKSDAQFVWLEVQPKSACGSCSSQTGCGAFSLSRYFSPKPSLLKIAKSFDVQDGEELVVGVEEGAFLKGSFLLYVLPLFSLFLGAFLGAQWNASGEWLSILMGLMGLFAGFFWVSRKGRSLQFSDLFHPKMRRSI